MWMLIFLSKFAMDNVFSTGGKVVFFFFSFYHSPLREKETKEKSSHWETLLCSLNFRLEDLRKSLKMGELMSVPSSK